MQEEFLRFRNSFREIMSSINHQLLKPEIGSINLVFCFNSKHRSCRFIFFVQRRSVILLLMCVCVCLQGKAGGPGKRGAAGAPVSLFLCASVDEELTRNYHATGLTMFQQRDNCFLNRVAFVFRCRSIFMTSQSQGYQLNQSERFLTH